MSEIYKKLEEFLIFPQCFWNSIPFQFQFKFYLTQTLRAQKVKVEMVVAGYIDFAS